jgi:hypothetical protein
MAEPIACTLRPGDLNARRAGLLPGLVARATAREPLPAGYRFTFAADSATLSAIASVIDAERQCCRFLEFRLIVAPAGGPFILDVSGPDGTREFLDGLTSA